MPWRKVNCCCGWQGYGLSGRYASVLCHFACRFPLQRGDLPCCPVFPLAAARQHRTKQCCCILQSRCVLRTQCLAYQRMPFDLTRLAGWCGTVLVSCAMFSRQLLFPGFMYDVPHKCSYWSCRTVESTCNAISMNILSKVDELLLGPLMISVWPQR